MERYRIPTPMRHCPICGRLYRAAQRVQACSTTCLSLFHTVKEQHGQTTSQPLGISGISADQSPINPPTSAYQDNTKDT